MVTIRTADPTVDTELQAQLSALIASLTTERPQGTRLCVPFPEELEGAPFKARHRKVPPKAVRRAPPPRYDYGALLNAPSPHARHQWWHREVRLAVQLCGTEPPTSRVPAGVTQLMQTRIAWAEERRNFWKRVPPAFRFKNDLNEVVPAALVALLHHWHDDRVIAVEARRKVRDALVKLAAATEFQPAPPATLLTSATVRELVRRFDAIRHAPQVKLLADAFDAHWRATNPSLPTPAKMGPLMGAALTLVHELGAPLEGAQRLYRGWTRPELLRDILIAHFAFHGVDVGRGAHLTPGRARDLVFWVCASAIDEAVACRTAVYVVDELHKVRRAIGRPGQTATNPDR